MSMHMPVSQTDEVNISFTMSNDRTVVTLVLSHGAEITNAMLADVLARTATVLLGDSQ